MKLKRPLISFDLETTGVDPENDRIVEIATIKLMPNGTRREKVARINPGRAIPLEASEVHGIKDEDVADKPPFKRIASSLYEFLSGCDFTGYNITRFDVPLLTAEFNRCGMLWPASDAKIVDAYTLVMRMESRNLSWAVEHYCGKQLEHAHLRHYCDERAHSALPDADGALCVLLAQADKYLVGPEQGDDDSRVLVDDLDLLQRDPDWIDSQGKFKRTTDGAVITFGKYKDAKLTVVPRDYLQWMLGQKFLDDAKQVIREELSIRRMSAGC